MGIVEELHVHTCRQPAGDARDFFQVIESLLGIGLRPLIIGGYLIQPERNLRLQPGVAAHGEDGAHGHGQALRQTMQSGDGGKRAAAQLDRAFAQGAENSVRRLAQGLHPREILVHHVSPCAEFTDQRRRPIGPLIRGRGEPAAAIGKLLGGNNRQPQAPDQFVAFYIAAQEPL